jgi:hypothetical protein
MRRSRRTGVTGGLLLMVAAVAVQATALPPGEQRKIEALLQHMATLTEVVFIRNEKAYQAATAVQFLRGKWRAKWDEIRTAQDFIETIASVSSTTGQPYRLRFPDGRVLPSRDYLRTVLPQLE